MKIKVGNKIRIISMKDEPSYIGRVGIVEDIDAIGQLHGSWGSLAIIPEVDKFEIIKNAVIIKVIDTDDKEIEEKEFNNYQEAEDYVYQKYNCCYKIKKEDDWYYTFIVYEG